MSNAGIDQNGKSTLTALSSANNGAVVTLWADPISHRLLVSGAGIGTVTSVSVVDRNGVSATVDTPTTTPALTFTLGDITPTSVNISGVISIDPMAGIVFNGAAFSVDLLGNMTVLGQVLFGASTTARAIFNLPAGSAPSAPNDGDVWRQDNTNTGLKIRINGVTKTISVS